MGGGGGGEPPRAPGWRGANEANNFSLFLKKIVN